ncbi:MAG TPA: hypothetical protein PLL73_09885, partial [Syntrophorhabdaceae bacterium]|nr:hypothetical protein [Syntrophorhabdaceae bacterium]
KTEGRRWVGGLEKAEGWKVRRIEGWKVGGVAKNQRSEGVKESKREGFKDSRIQGVKWFSWHFFQNIKVKGSRGQVKEAEG